MMSVKIRRAEIGDYEKLLKLMQKFYIHTVNNDDKGLEADWAFRVLPGVIKKELGQWRNRVAYFMAEKDNKAIGYLLAEIKKVPAYYKERKEIYIWNIYV